MRILLPNIVWVDGSGTTLTEDRRNNQLRFLDNGRYLVIRQLTTEQVNTNYQCQVTNAQLHETVRNNIVYDLVPTLGANETVIYKRLMNRTIQSGTTIEYSYIASAGRDVMPFGLLSTLRTIRQHTVHTTWDTPWWWYCWRNHTRHR